MNNIFRALALTAMFAAPALAQESSGLTLDLNNLQSQDGACRITFVASNSLAADLDKLGFEVVLFNTQGLVERMVALDFGAMAQGRTKVLQFNLPALDCSAVGRVLINDVTCEDTEVECLDALALESRSEIAFGL